MLADVWAWLVWLVRFLSGGILLSAAPARGGKREPEAAAGGGGDGDGGSCPITGERGTCPVGFGAAPGASEQTTGGGTCPISREGGLNLKLMIPGSREAYPVTNVPPWLSAGDFLNLVSIADAVPTPAGWDWDRVTLRKTLDRFPLMAQVPLEEQGVQSNALLLLEPMRVQAEDGEAKQ